MAGEYGIGQGIVQGMQLANQGMVNVESIQANREARRQNAEKTAAYLQTAQVQQNASNEQLKILQFKFDEMQKQKAIEDSFNAFNAYEDTGDIKYLNLAREKNPLLNDMFTKNGTVSMHGINEFSEEKLTSLGYTPGKYVKPIVITKNDGSQAIEDLTGTYVASGYLKEMRKDKLDDLVLRVKENQMKTEEANLPLVEAKAQFSTQILNDLQKQVIEGKISPEDAWSRLNNKMSGTSDKRPFDVQSAEYFGNIKSKIDEGTATPAEKATYNSWLTKEGGSNVAANEKVSTDVNKLANKGIDLSSPDFKLSNVDPKYKNDVDTTIRNLEETPGGKKLVTNISKKLGDGLGAVQTASTKIADLATKENVETAVVKNQIDAVKQYIPEALRGVTEEDLKDVNFRQAYLSVTATMLKMQSGLTVSEAEANRFAASMGTLNKNTKVNMSGLKNKVDEIIGDYEANKTLEPTLYNAKYREPIQGLKNVSTQLDKYLGNTSTTNYKVGQKAQDANGNVLVFNGKGWVKQQ